MQIWGNTRVVNGAWQRVTWGILISMPISQNSTWQTKTESEKEKTAQSKDIPWHANRKHLKTRQC